MSEWFYILVQISFSFVLKAVTAGKSVTGTIKNNARIEALRLKGIFFVKAMEKNKQGLQTRYKKMQILYF